MADLLLVSDALITDFSSSAGDYALLNRPLILFQSDYDEYVEKDRGFYFDMNDSPYFIAKNQEELEVIIAKLTEDKVKENCKEILDFYGTCETGKSSEVIANRIIDWMN
jgi:CDP-glycerol glycerophosphotransferase